MTRDDLLRFCAPESFVRPNIGAPFSAGEYTFATNGHVIVRVPRMDGIPENPDAPGPGTLFPYDEPKEWFPVAAIDMPTKIKMVECGYCNGDKQITHEDCPHCSGHDCENCNGSGKVELVTPISVGCAHFQHKYLLWLRDLPNCKIGPIDALKEAPFQFDGGDGLLMPMKVGV